MHEGDPREKSGIKKAAGAIGRMVNKKVSIENGYATIANDLIEAIISADLDGRTKDIIWLIARLSYGYKQNAGWTKPINYEYIGKVLNMKRQNVYRSVKSLLDKNIIKRSGAAARKKYKIESNLSLWNNPQLKLNL